MAYKIIFSETARKEFLKLDKPIKKRITSFLEERIEPNPHLLKEPLHGNKKGLWKYRVGNYRIICQILNDELVVLVVDIGHRGEVYK